LLGEGPGQSEEDQEDHIGAIATIVSPTDPAQDPTAGPLLNYTASTLIKTGAMHNYVAQQAVEKAGLKPIKRLSSAVSLIHSAELPIAGVYLETLRVTNGNEETCLQLVTLRCVNLHEFDIVLGMPWTTEAKPVFHWD
jgi:hypothetical protein